MDYLLPLASLAGGVVLLLAGGNVLVQHAVHLAVSYRVPKTVVGAIILGFGTSLPELFVSVTAALDGSPGIAIGNVVGSNIANIGLVLGLGAFMVPLYIERRTIRTDLPLGVLAALLIMLWVGPQLEVSRITGMALMACFGGYLWLSLRYSQNFRQLQTDTVPPPQQPVRDSLLVLFGLVLISVGARILVGGAEQMAHLLNVSDRIIGLSMVALSTSLPELATVYAAARNGEASLAVGTIAGSNLFNLLFVLGTAAIVHPIPVEGIMQVRDFPILVAFSVLAFPLMVSTRRIGRAQGLLLLTGYVAYLAWTWGAA